MLRLQMDCQASVSPSLGKVGVSCFIEGAHKKSCLQPGFRRADLSG